MSQAAPHPWEGGVAQRLKIRIEAPDQKEVDSAELAALAPYLRKTPKQYRSRARLSALLDTSARLLHEQGIEAFSMSSIADEMQIAPSSIYEYVADASQLMAAIAVRGLARMSAGYVQFTVAGSKAIDMRAQLTQRARFFLEHYSNEPGLRVAIQALENDPIYSQIMLDESRRNAKAFATWLASSDPAVSSESLLDRCLVLIHLASSAARLVESVEPDEAARVLEAYVDLTIGLVPSAS